MIFPPDPLKRAKRELQAALNQAIDAEVQKQHAFSMAEYVNAKSHSFKPTSNLWRNKMPKILLIDTDDFLGAADFLSRQMARKDVAVQPAPSRRLTGADVLEAMNKSVAGTVTWEKLPTAAKWAYEEQARILNSMAGL